MAETLISPGVLARENDQSQVTSQPVQAGACIVGPTVLGSVNIPKLVTSYSEYLANFGSTFISGSDTYTYFTSISAYNYFNNGGTSLIVNRVASGSWTPSTTTLDPIRNEVESTKLQVSPYNFTGSAASTARGGESGTYTGVAVLIDGVASTGTTFDVVRGQTNGKLYTGQTSADTDASSIAFRFDQGTNPVTCQVSSTFTNVTVGGGSGAGAKATVVTSAQIGVTQRGDLSSLTITTPGTGYAAGDVLTLGAGSLGSGMLKVAAITPSLVNTGGTTAAGTATITEGTAGVANTYQVANGTADSKGAGATFTVAFAKSGVFSTSTITTAGTAITNITPAATTSTNLNVADLVAAGATITNGGAGGVVTITTAGGSLTAVNLVSGGTGYTTSSILTLSAASINSISGYSGATGGAVTATFANANIITTITSITPTAATFVAGFQAGNTITITAGDVASLTGNTVFTLASGNLDNSGAAEANALQITTTGGNSQNTNNNLIIEPTSIVLNTQDGADSVALNNILSVAAANIGTPTLPPSIGSANLQVTLVDADIKDAEAFTLESLSDGTIMNSGTAEGTNGTLTNGTVDNIRWEIQATDVATGTFSVVIRQGNDTATAKRVLEIFPNVSLDSQASNYIERIIGNQTKVFNGAGTSDPFISTVGSFPNASRYVRVKEVQFKTPNYFDNNGQAKTAFAPYLPDVGSGSFSGAEGELFSKTGFPAYNRALYYDSIGDGNTQGMTTTEMATYTDAFNLLANKDDYSYNIITSPGLYYAASMMATPMNVLIQNTQTRGDAIAIVDLVSYAGGTVTTARAQAASLDNSYAAAYWPWVQIMDPDSRQLVWTVPSAMIPGVYAFNDRTSEAWFAPAGINRGGLSTVVQAQRKLTQTNRDDLYTGKVNPIATFPGKGVVVFGQKTLQSQASALDRINVRRLLIALKSFIVQIADNLVFEQNTAATRNNFLSQVNPYLESVQQRQGLYAFKVQMDSANNGPDVVDRNQMVGAIYIQPTKTAEFIYLDFNILPTGATFPS